MEYTDLEIELDVTQEDIDKSLELIKENKYWYNCVCPVAVSLQRTYNTQDVTVSYTCVRIGYGYAYRLPEDIQRLIINFDRTKKMIPFKGKYKLPIIDF